MKKVLDEIIRRMIEPIALDNGFRKIPYQKGRDTQMGWIFFRDKNELRQDFAIEISNDYDHKVILSSNSIAHGFIIDSFNTEKEFEASIIKIKEPLLDLIYKLDTAAADCNRIMKINELYLKNNFDELLKQFFCEHEKEINNSFIEGCDLIDSVIGSIRGMPFSDSINKLYCLSAYLGHLLLCFEDTYLVWNENKYRLEVSKNSLFVQQVPLLVKVYNIWSDVKYKKRTIIFLRPFFTNDEIMNNTSIRNELIRLGDFDIKRGY